MYGVQQQRQRTVGPGDGGQRPAYPEPEQHHGRGAPRCRVRAVDVHERGQFGRERGEDRRGAAQLLGQPGTPARRLPGTAQHQVPGEVGEQPGQPRVRRGVGGAERGPGHQAAGRDDPVAEGPQQRGLAQAGFGADPDQLDAAGAGDPVPGGGELAERLGAAEDPAGERGSAGDVRPAGREGVDVAERGQVLLAAAQVGEDATGGLVPVLRRHREQPVQHAGKSGRESGDRRRGLGELGVYRLRVRPGPGGQLVQDDAEGVQVGPLVDVTGQPAGLFGRRVPGPVGQPARGVEQGHLTVRADQHAVRADPTVQPRPPVPQGERTGDRAADVQEHGTGQRRTQRPEGTDVRRGGTASRGLAAHWHVRPFRGVGGTVLTVSRLRTADKYPNAV